MPQRLYINHCHILGKSFQNARFNKLQPFLEKPFYSFSRCLGCFTQVATNLNNNVFHYLTHLLLLITLKKLAKIRLKFLDICVINYKNIKIFIIILINYKRFTLYLLHMNRFNLF